MKHVQKAMKMFANSIEKQQQQTVLSGQREGRGCRRGQQSEVRAKEEG